MLVLELLHRLTLIALVAMVTTLSINQAVASGTSIHENLSGGFLIEHPDDWQAIELQDPLIKAMVVPTTLNPDDPVNAISLIMVEPLSFKIDLFDYSELAIQNLDTSLENFKLIEEFESTLGKLPAKKIKYTGVNEFGLPVTGTAVWTIKDDKAFIIVSMADSTQYTEYSKDIRVIEDSFKFMGQAPAIILGDYADPELGLEVVFPEGWAAIEFVSEAIEYVDSTKMVMAEPPTFSQTRNFDDFVTIGIFSTKISGSDYQGMLENFEETGCEIPKTATIMEINGMKAIEFEMDCVLEATGAPISAISHSFLIDDAQINTMFMAGSDQIYNKEFSTYEKFLDSLTIKNTKDLSDPSKMASLFGLSTTQKTVQIGSNKKEITLISKSSITDFTFDKQTEGLSFSIVGESDSISIYPDKILNPPYSVTIDGKDSDNITIAEDKTTGKTLISIYYVPVGKTITVTGTLLDQFISSDQPASVSKIPDWVRGNAQWWSQGAIGDTDFVSGIQYLIKEGIMTIPETAKGESFGSKEIPSWIKNNADWWAQGLISDDDFVKGIQFLIENGIMEI